MVKTRKAIKSGKLSKTPEKMAMKMDGGLDMFEDNFGNDMDCDGENMGQKTPKGKQSMNDKRVSFQVPGKNTPGNKNGSFVKKQNTPGKGNMQNTPGKGKMQNTPGKGGMQNTPGKGGLQSFKGMKQNNKANKNFKQNDDDEEDDDDDEDDEDFEFGDLMGEDIDEDEDDDDDEEDDDDDDDEDEEAGGNKVGKKEDDDEDEDDDDDEDDEDDDEDDDEKEIMQNITQQIMQQKQKTPNKNVEKSNVASPKKEKKQIQNSVQTPNSVKKEKAQTPKENTLQKVPPVPKDEVERRRERDAKQLFVGNIPADVKQEELKALSKDIRNIVMPFRPRQRVGYAFLQFESEEVAEKNLEILKTKKLRGELLKVDYAGEKSLLKKSKEAESFKYNMKKLHVSNIPLSATIHELSEFFPKCFQVSFNLSPIFRTATISFLSEEDTNEAYKSCKDITINGQKLSVLHALTSAKRKPKRKQRASSKRPNKNQPAKKIKMAPKEEDSD